MAEDYKDKIQEIRARRGRGSAQSYSPGQSNSPFDNTGQVGANRAAPTLGVNVLAGGASTSTSAGVGGATGVGGPGVVDAPRKPGEVSSPWSYDRVTLSQAGQIAMLETRGLQRLPETGFNQTYNIIPIKPGWFIQRETPGTYRRVYHYRLFN